LRSDPTLEQADILSVLLFGKPASELNEGQQAKMSDTATAIATTYAADRVAQSVANAVGLERAGIQIEEASSSRVALGKYLTEKTYLRVGQDIGGNGGQEAAIDYEIIPNWELETSTTSAGAHGADVIWHKRY
jgi:translocation and assembly module TamB